MSSSRKNNAPDSGEIRVILSLCVGLFLLLQIAGFCWGQAVGASQAWAPGWASKWFMTFIADRSILSHPVQYRFSIPAVAVHFVGRLLFDIAPLVLAGVAVANRIRSARTTEAMFLRLYLFRALGRSLIIAVIVFLIASRLLVDSEAFAFSIAMESRNPRGTMIEVTGSWIFAAVLVLGACRCFFVVLGMRSDFDRQIARLKEKSGML